MRGLETLIRLDIRRFLRNLGFAVWDMEQNRPTRQTAGFPDLVAIGRGRILFVEVKAPKGRLSPAQQVFREECLANGGTYLVWRSASEAWDYLEANGMVSRAPGG